MKQPTETWEVTTLNGVRVYGLFLGKSKPMTIILHQSYQSYVKTIATKSLVK